MNILLLLFLYFIFTLTGGGKESGFLSGLKLDKFSPLINLFSGGKFDLDSLLKSDLLKNLNIKGLDIAKIAPIWELYTNLKSSDLFSSKDKKSEESEKKSETKPDFPLSPISDIADKNITYSLSKYLSNN
jgi:hypothetical protein